MCTELRSPQYLALRAHSLEGLCYERNDREVQGNTLDSRDGQPDLGLADAGGGILVLREVGSLLLDGDGLHLTNLIAL